MVEKLAYEYLFPLLWLAWFAIWGILSHQVKENARKEAAASRMAHLLPLAIAALLLFPERTGFAALDGFVLAPSAWWFLWGALITAAGLALTVWARFHIGRNWSGIVTVKRDHELVTSGPYAWVRHPIYTGLLLAFLGSALARDQWRGAVAVLIAFLALWRKLRLEERWMREEFGPRYSEYANRVAALIPFVL